MTASPCSALLLALFVAASSSASAQPAPEPAPGADDQVGYFYGLEQELEKIRVVSASQQEEPLRDTPVPVTVITAEMIRAIGARNLKDVLITYVPGFTSVEDHNELNVAMRGIYGSSQQKILILLDGHRLNSRAYSSANPDFSISLDKVRQIEVLRGPGSSLYGNVALAAVINLVTKRGKDAEGVSAHLSAGDYGQLSGSLLLGHEWAQKGAFLAWGSVYRSEGQRVSIPASANYAAEPVDGYALLGAHRDPLSYDFGLRLEYGAFSFLASTRHGHYVEPFTSSGVTGEAYDYDAVRTLLTTGPGVGQRSDHLELRYARPLGASFDIEASAYYDRSDLSGLLVSSPTTAVFLQWNDDDVGVIGQLRYRYALERLGAGNFTAGLQVEHQRVLDSFIGRSANFEWVAFADTRDRHVLAPGAETLYSAFLQLKHRLNDALLFNVGLRFDLKDRFRGGAITDLSPRAAIVYSPLPELDVKLSFARSFVDAPYWYRYNSLASYRGAESLTPEHLDSFQLTPTVRFGKISNTLNVFYNHLYDFVFRNNLAGPDEPIYQNAGTLRTLGVEDELAYVDELFSLRANATYQHVLSAMDYGTRGSQIFNVPAFSSNVIVDVTPLPKRYRNLAVNLTARYVSPQLSPVEIRFADATGATVREYAEPDRTVAGALLFNAGIRVTDLLTPGLSLDVTVYNLLDRQYQQGGSVLHPYPQPGRWLLLTLGYRFTPEL